MAQRSTNTSSEISSLVAGIAKSGARTYQLSFAHDALVDARAELRVALRQVAPADDTIIVLHMRKALAQIEYALKQVEAAQ